MSPLTTFHKRGSAAAELMKILSGLYTADEIMRDSTKFQYGSVLLATLTFLLILVELICV